MVNRIFNHSQLYKMAGSIFSVPKELYKEFFKSAFLGSLFIAISAQLAVNFGIIPFTLQTSAIFLVVYRLGAVQGTAAVLMYLLEGAAGLPVFQNFTGGILPFVGPSGGYLLGFAPMAYVFGSILRALQGSKALSSRGYTFLTVILAEAIATVVDYVFGYAQLLNFVSPGIAYAAGIVPFLFTGAAKILLTAAFIAQATRRI